VSRLYDRVLAHGCKPLRIELAVPRSLIEEERGPDARDLPIAVSEEALQRSDIQGASVFALDDAAEYVASLTVDGSKIRDTPRDVLHSFYGVIRPPFDRCLLEFRGRFWEGGQGTTTGWLVEVEDAGPPPGDAEEWLREVRWFLSMKLLMEIRPREILGPYIRHVLPLNGYGEPLHPPGDVGPGISEHLPDFTPELTEQESLYLRGLSMYLAWPAIFGLSLMNCKNVDLREVGPPQKLSRKHQRQRGVPLTSYYVLDIKPMRRVLDTEGEAQTKGLAHALHICRGHFKTFTEDAPLFGKRVGTYWWEAQVRGKAEEGVVEKDYRVRLDQGLGREYRPMDEHAEIAPNAPEHTGLDPDLGGRGLRSHNVTQNLVAAAVEEAGFEPRRPKPDEPQYDIAWEQGDVTWVAEVKSVTEQNEERQLRQALGQVLRYRQLLEADGRSVRAMIAVEHEPSDPSWGQLCANEGIVLAWPPIKLAP
jgi:hypothetical protein